jgi:hypothetical protein
MTLLRYVEPAHDRAAVSDHKGNRSAVRIRTLTLEDGLCAGSSSARRQGADQKAPGSVKLGRSVARVCIELLTLADCEIRLEELKKLIRRDGQTEGASPPFARKVCRVRTNAHENFCNL